MNLPSFKTAATTAAIVLVTLFIVSRFAPPTVKKQIGLSA